ncbi:MAG: acyltransferase 3 [Sphingomonas bacterium]|nr:acyltransferase 3 [Sphingomonas bacterium]
MGERLAERRTYDTLNGIRGIAALCVAIFHTNAAFWPATARSGFLAVDVFFVLSGFVLASSYGERLTTGQLAPIGFMRARLVRFYPLYIAGLALGVIQALAQQAVHSQNAMPSATLGVAMVSALLFLPVGIASLGSLTPLNPPAWSLLFEFWINAGWAPLAKRFGRTMEVAVLLISGALFVDISLRSGTMALGSDWSTALGGLARAVFSFAAGLLLYRARGVLPTIETRWSLLILAAVVALLFTAPGNALAYDLGVALVASPSLIFAGSRINPPASIRPLFSFLGMISFPLYAIHEPLLLLWAHVVRAGDITPATAGLSFFAALIALAWLAHHADEWVRADRRRYFWVMSSFLTRPWRGFSARRRLK